VINYSKLKKLKKTKINSSIGVKNSEFRSCVEILRSKRWNFVCQFCLWEKWNSFKLFIAIIYWVML